jgi:hypothetical protein
LRCLGQAKNDARIYPEEQSDDDQHQRADSPADKAAATE